MGASESRDLALETLIAPHRLYSRSEALSKPSPIPAVSGIYAWYFSEISRVTPIEGCIASGDKILLYVGISPDKAGKPNSTQDLRKRITYHYRGNAEGSTLRRTLGTLLAPRSGFPLRRVGSGKRMTLTHAGEKWLDSWMEQNAFVCWMPHSSPWQVEKELIGNISLPLNIRGNESHNFVVELKALRREAIRQARELPVADEISTARSD